MMPNATTSMRKDRKCRIFLIRHGQSWEDVDNNIYDRIADSEIELTEIGQKQSVSLGDALHKKGLSNGAKVFISPGIRTKQTYQIMASRLHGIECLVQEEPLIRKQSWGTFPLQDRRSIEEERYRVGVFFYKFPNGESGRDVYCRIDLFVDELEKQFDSPDFPDDVIIITHGLELRLLMMKIFRWSVEEFEALAGPPNGCHVTILHTGRADYILDKPYPAYQGSVSRIGRDRQPFDGVPRRK